MSVLSRVTVEESELNVTVRSWVRVGEPLRDNVSLRRSLRVMDAVCWAVCVRVRVSRCDVERELLMDRDAVLS